MTPEERITAEGLGWVMADSVAVTPKDVAPGDTINITAHFTNTASYLPAYATLQVKLDGLVIWEQIALFPYGGSSDSYPISYTLPVNMNGGSHRITANESAQNTQIPYDEFLITSPPPPGQRNVSFSSIPAGAQISVGNAYVGDTPVTISLSPGTYAVTALYNGQTLSKNVQVSSGSGSMSVPFTFTRSAPAFDLTKWLSDNKWYLGATVVGLGVLYLAVKKPATLQRGATKAYELAGKGYEKAKEIYQKSMVKD